MTDARLKNDKHIKLIGSIFLCVILAMIFVLISRTHRFNQSTTGSHPAEVNFGGTQHAGNW